jgi:hypothetical protein
MARVGKGDNGTAMVSLAEPWHVENFDEATSRALSTPFGEAQGGNSNTFIPAEMLTAWQTRVNTHFATKHQPMRARTTSNDGAFFTP